MKPVYPEILTPNNTLQIIDNGNGTISIAEEQEFLIQDVKVRTTGRSDLTFPVTPGKTYHLRYSLNGRPINNYKPNPNSFYLVDVTDSSYNPNEVDESDAQFDTKYDDMLIGKITVDNNGNVSILPLRNKTFFKERIQGKLFWSTSTGQPESIEIGLNLGRKIYPKIILKGFTDGDDPNNSLWLDATNLPDEGWKIYNHKNYMLTAIIAWSASRYSCRVIGNTEEIHFGDSTAHFGTGVDAVRFDVIVEG